MEIESSQPTSVWIVHRDERAREALARLAGPGNDTLLGGPGDSQFESAAAPSAVVLGLSGDFERELEFAHRMLPRFPDCSWILSPEPGDSAEVERLFEGLSGQLLAYPPEPSALRRAIGNSLHHRRAQSLAGRRGRDQLTTRFAHWFGDLEIPGLMGALDPQLASLPVIVCGETGTGRALIARYVHSFGGEGDKPFVHVACQGAEREADLLSQLEDAASEGGNAGSAIFLDEVDLLSAWLQRRVKDWIEFGLPGSTAALDPVRWMASASDSRDWSADRTLDPQLELMLSALPLYTPSLRTQPDAIGLFAQEAARRWSSRGGRSERSFSDQAIAFLQSHSWPGNLRELEATIVRTLSSTRADPLLPQHLCFEAAEGKPGLGESYKPPSLLPQPAAPTPAARADESISKGTKDTPGPRTRKPVDLAAILDSTVDDLRDRIQERRLLVLKELDRSAPFVLGDGDELRMMLSALVSHALASVPERGDMYLASSRHPDTLDGGPSVRVLLRYRLADPDADAPFDPEGMAPMGDEANLHTLDLAERVVLDHGGTFTVDTGDRRERVIVIDLPATPDSPTP